MRLLDRATPREMAMLETSMYLIASLKGIPVARPTHPVIARTVDEISLTERLMEEIDALESEVPDFGVAL